jgi:hypothetical protein
MVPISSFVPKHTFLQIASILYVSSTHKSNIQHFITCIQIKPLLPLWSPQYKPILNHYSPLIPKDPRVFLVKTASNQPLLKRRRSVQTWIIF